MEGASITTGSMTKALFSLINHILFRNCLRKRRIDGTARPESHVEFAGHHYGTPFTTYPTASALIPINESGLFAQLHIEISRLPTNTLYFCISTEGDVLM
jgi:hypothetical protein